LPALEALKDSVSLVITQPDRPRGRGMKLQPTLVKLRAMKLGLRVESPEKSRSPEFLEVLRAENADALVVASYGQILSQAVLDSAKRGGINLHGSILPKYRGAAPIQRCVMNGDGVTGLTLMQMDKGMDTGGVIEIVTTPIGHDETYTELQDRLALIAAELAVEWMPRIVAGDYVVTPQDSDLATIAPKIERSESELSFERDASFEYNRFRALTSTPGAFVQTRLGSLRIHQARLGKGSDSASPGEVVAVRESLQVAFANGSLEFAEVQLEGKKRMGGRDFANGARLKPGDRLSN
jgi:methionyl-tRNA formyltransferase